MDGAGCHKINDILDTAGKVIDKNYLPQSFAKGVAGTTAYT